MKKTAFIGAALYLLPFAALAQTNPASGLLGLINFAGTVINAIIPVLVGAAVVVFFWGLVKYIYSRKKGDKDIMWWGIIALFLMVSVWGIIRIAQSTLGIGGVQTLPVPRVDPGSIRGS